MNLTKQEALSKIKELEDYINQCDTTYKVEDITFKIAQEICIKNSLNPDPKNYFTGKALELLTIIKAVNFIDNDNKEWKADFTNRNQYKYLPYFKNSDSGWSASGVYCYFSFSSSSVGFYFKLEKSAKLIQKKYIDSYNQYLG